MLQQLENCKNIENILKGQMAPLLQSFLLCWSIFGTWGSQAQEFLNNLRKKASSINGRSYTQFQNYWRKRFSVTLQRSNSRVVLKVSKIIMNRLTRDDDIAVIGTMTFNASHINIWTLLKQFF